MSNNQHQSLQDNAVQYHQEKMQLKKSTKRNMSRGKRSKSKKSKSSSIDRDLDENNYKQTQDEFYVGERVEGMDQQRVRKGLVLVSTTISTKKPLSQQQKHGKEKNTVGVNNQHNQPNGNNLNHTKPSSQRQVKLNYFLKKGQLTSISHNNNNTNTNKSDNNNNNNNNNINNINNLITSSSLLTSTKYAITQNQRKQSSLQKRLKQKQSILQRMKLDKQIHMQRFSKLKLQSEEYKIKCRQTMEKQLKQYGKVRRQQRAEIDPKYGYYKQGGQNIIFVQGECLVNNKRKSDQLNKIIKQLQQKKRTCTTDQRQSTIAQIDHLNKLLTQQKQQKRKLQLLIAQYKDRLRLSEKQQSCTIARQNWDVIENRYLPIQLLGCGGFGEVYKAYDLDTNTHVAIKINCFQPMKSQQVKQQFLKHVHRQVATLKQLNHPNIAKLIDEIMIDNKMSFVLQYCSGPELSKYLAKNQFLTQHQARGIIKQVSFALRYMFNQRHRVIHYDLKPANIIFHHGCVKILDFGLCKKMETQDTKIDLTSQGVGTYWYLPPQTFMDGAQISSKVDVWSLGVIFFQLLYGKRPFGHGVGQNKIYRDGIILKALKVDFPTDKIFKVSDAAKDFIRECLRYKAEQRLDPQEVYRHEYLRN